MNKKIKWHDPREKMWGFHVHQELPLENFSHALVIQAHCLQFLQAHGVHINANDAIKPGYGPHLNYMWELRVEHNDQTLEKMGLAISYMAINHFGLSAYIHPIMHDTALSEEDALKGEGRDNQANALWFSHKVEQFQDFFFNPPKDHHNKIIDTRTSRIMSMEERDQLYTIGEKTLTKQMFLHPFETIVNGFHIHMDFTGEEEAIALVIFDHFLLFLLEVGLRPTSTRLYGPGENGPHIQSGWEVKFETANQAMLQKIGIAIGWLMCNRQHLSIFMHPVTWKQGDDQEELKAHEKYSMFIGELPPLDLNFFRHP